MVGRIYQLIPATYFLRSMLSDLKFMWELGSLCARLNRIKMARKKKNVMKKKKIMKI